MDNLLTAATLILLFLLVLKLLDMFLFSIFWNLKYGIKCSNDFHEELENSGIEKALDVLIKHKRDPMRLCKQIANLKPVWVFKNIVNYVYRWPTLTALVSISIIFSPNLTLKYILASTALLSVLIEYTNQIIVRLTIGVVDNINVSAYLNISEIPPPEYENWHTSRILRDALLTLIVELFVFTLTFGILYWFLYSLNNIHFAALKDASLIDFMYLSVVSVTSAGFGDYLPDGIAKFLLLIQLSVSWTFVLIIVFHYGASLSTPFKKSK